MLWRIENGEIPLNLQVAFVHCGTNNLDRDNPAEIRDGIASIVYTIQEKKPNANFIVSGLLPRDQETSSRRDKTKLVNQKLREWCRSDDMPQAVNSELLLYADDTCLIYMGKDIQKIEEQLNSDFTSLCEWFIDNKLSVHFGEEKTKSILFGTKRQLKDQRDLNLKYGDIEIEQHSKVTYLGCTLDNILSGEHMAAKVLNTVNNRLKFLYRKQKFLSLSLRRLLCNALIQPHFDYACAAWYPLLNKRQSKRIQIAQNKCIRYCLNLDNKAHIGTNEFLKINWLSTKKRVEQCICVNVFNFFNQMSPQYTAEIFHPSSSVHNTRRATQKLDLPFRKSCIGQKTLSYIGPKTWNNLPAQIKLSKNVNTFKHDIKKSFFDDLQKQNDDIFFYY